MRLQDPVGAVVFSAAGLYALMAVAVARRTREIGIRIALGRHAPARARQRVRPCGSSARWWHHRRQQPHPAHAWRADSLSTGLVVSCAMTSVIMAVGGVLACAAPARRARGVQATEALRQA